jgi:hypothetical protein
MNLDKFNWKYVVPQGFDISSFKGTPLRLKSLKI